MITDFLWEGAVLITRRALFGLACRLWKAACNNMSRVWLLDCNNWPVDFENLEREDTCLFVIVKAIIHNPKLKQTGPSLGFHTFAFGKHAWWYWDEIGNDGYGINRFSHFLRPLNLLDTHRVSGFRTKSAGVSCSAEHNLCYMFIHSEAFQSVLLNQTLFFWLNHSIIRILDASSVIMLYYASWIYLFYDY